MKKTYVETGFGQIHCRITAAESNQNKTILFLHPMPFSGLFYDTTTPYLNKNHTVISPDYPGYGGSDRIADISIEKWADCMAETLEALNIEHPAEIIGFHTGCLVGTELSLRHPKLVNKLLLIDAPYFDATDRADMLKNNSAPPEFTKDVTSLAGIWKMNVGSKLGKVTVNRAMENLAEHLRNGENANLGFAAAFRYDADRMKKITHPTLIIASKSNMYETSLAAAELISDSTLIERKDIEPPVFEVYAQQIADEILQYLS